MKSNMPINYRLCQGNPFSDHISCSCLGRGMNVFWWWLCRCLLLSPSAVFISFQFLWSPSACLWCLRLAFVALYSFRWMFSEWDFVTLSTNLCKFVCLSPPWLANGFPPLTEFLSCCCHSGHFLLCCCPCCFSFSCHPLTLCFTLSWASLSALISAWWPLVRTLSSLSMSP